MPKDDRDVMEMTKEELVDRYGRLVTTAVRGAWSRCAEVMSLDDMRSCAFEGLLHAREAYDPSCGVEFGNFAYLRVRGAILDGARRARWAPREQKFHCCDNATALQINANRETGSGERGDDRPESVVVDSATNDMQVYLMLLGPGEFAELDVAAGDIQSDEVLRRQLCRLVSEAMDQLGDIERAVVRLYELEERTLEEIAEEFDCTDTWVLRLRDRAIAEMREYVEERLESVDYAWEQVG